jgi:hypothetical protein
MRKKKNSDLSYHKSDIFYIRLRQYDTFSLQFFDRVLKSQEIKAMLMIACDTIKNIRASRGAHNSFSRRI